MRLRKNTKRLGLRAVVAAVAAGSVFQLSSCTVGNDGSINAFANPVALTDLGNQLFEASPFGRLLGDVDGSLEIHVGDGQ